MEKQQYGYYTDYEEGASQYDDIFDKRMVEARYIPAILPADKGNPYIEALPPPRTETDVLHDYRRGIPGYDRMRISKESKLEKMLEVNLLKNVRFPLPFEDQLEFEFYNCLISSYRSRWQMRTKKDRVTYTANDTECTSDSILTGDSASPTNSGFCLIGRSGCGKSSAIETLISRYPQVILHEDEYGRFPQITYLVVNCTPNSNFTALYCGIADAIDKALGNIRPVYGEDIKRARSLGEKAEKIKTYVETFAIGVLLFDEVQELDFSSVKENSFDSLLTLANRTKVGLCVIGTEDAKDKMFGTLRTARRIGRLIPADLYCADRDVFDRIVRRLFHYQWFDETVEVTPEITDTFYDLTKGIIDQIFSLYECLTYDYLANDGTKKVTCGYIREISEKYYPGIQKILQGMDVEKMEKERLALKEAADQKIQALLYSAKDGEDEASYDIEEIKLEDVTKIVTGMYDYSEDEIEKAFSQVMKKKGSDKKSAKEISRDVAAFVEKWKKPKTKKGKSLKSPKAAEPDYEQIKEYLNI